MMMQERIILVATVIVALSGVLWGFFWVPVRALEAMGLPGAWGTVAMTFAALLLLAPLAHARRGELAGTDKFALVSLALGGAAFTLYSVGLIYGRVAIVILLFFLTPVWSALIGRYVMGWPTPRLRLWAILVGLAGLLVILGAEGEIPVPRGAGEWMALLGGILWSVGSTGIRTRSTLAPAPSTFVFVLGAASSALVLAPFLDPLPDTLSPGGPLGALRLALVSGGLWWVLSIAALTWATMRLEPARVGILMMTEVLVGAVSAAVLAGENLALLEILGGVLVLLAGVLEVWPVRQKGQPPR